MREPGWKLNQRGELFDMSDAPFVEKAVAPEAETDEAKAARQRLAAALAELNPAGGKTDANGDKPGRANRQNRNNPDPAPAAPAAPAAE